MLNRIFRFAREGSLAVALSVAVVGAPAVAEASLWDDIKEIAPVVPQLFNPQHSIGKMLTGATVWASGWAGAALVASLAAPPLAVPILIGVGVVGLGLLAWGMVELVRDLNGSSGPRTIPGDRIPGTGGETTRPNGGGGLPNPDGNTTNTPTTGGTNTTPNPGGELGSIERHPGINVGRDATTTPGAGNGVPNRRPVPRTGTGSAGTPR